MQKDVVRGLCLKTRTVTFFVYDAEVDGSYYECVNCDSIASRAYHIFGPPDELYRQLLDYWYPDTDEDPDEEWRCYDLHPK